MGAPAVGLLHGVNCQGSDGVNGERIQLLIGHYRLFDGYHMSAPLTETLLILWLVLLESEGNKGLQIRPECINFHRNNVC
jgi:hypothetical protein